MRYLNFEVLSFDCYGTLIDWETGLANAFGPWRSRLPEAARAGAGDETLLAAFARHETAVQQAQPDLAYPQVLAQVMEAVSRECGAPATAEECAAFGASVGEWPPFPDSARALHALRWRYRLCVLSNVDRASFERSLDLMMVPFDYVFTADGIGAYKPDPRAFRFMLDALKADDIPAARVLHVAQSLYHDHEPAQAAGISTVWIDRRAGRPGGAASPAPQARFDARFEDLASFASAAL